MVSSALPTGLAGAGLSATSARSTSESRLKPAAHEFEACLMKEFLEPLQKDPLFGEDGDSGGSGNALMSYGSEALARGISERGGFGIATKIIDHFKTGKASQEKAESGSGS
jgi:peptidoglycan hydrolase FlgJ